MSVPAGWYADGRTATSMRYWDGWQWTSHVWDVPPPQPVIPAPRQVKSPEAKRKQLRRDLILTACLLTVAALVGGVLWRLFTLPTTYDPLSATGATLACERAIEMKLAGGKADSFDGESYKQLSDKSFLVVGTVYAPNSFNAIVGQGFTCTATDVGNGQVSADATFVPD